MTINLDPSNECLDWTQMPAAMQFHARELQMREEFTACQQPGIWSGGSVFAYRGDQRLEKEASGATVSQYNL